MGICNGFQILCESGLLPGALLRNTNMKFVCKNVHLTPINTNTMVTSGLHAGSALTIPIAHGEGRFYADAETLEHLEKNNQVVFRYCDASGNPTEESNPNGSLNNIAGVCNAGFNAQRRVFLIPTAVHCLSPSWRWLLHNLRLFQFFVISHV
jgi:phosphoribosylformylglycinamidine synthase